MGTTETIGPLVFSDASQAVLRKVLTGITTGGLEPVGPSFWLAKGETGLLLDILDYMEYRHLRTKVDVGSVRRRRADLAGFSEAIFKFLVNKSLIKDFERDYFARIFEVLGGVELGIGRKRLLKELQREPELAGRFFGKS